MTAALHGAACAKEIAVSRVAIGPPYCEMQSSEKAAMTASADHHRLCVTNVSYMVAYNFRRSEQIANEDPSWRGARQPDRRRVQKRKKRRQLRLLGVGGRRCLSAAGTVRNCCRWDGRARGWAGS